MGARPVGEGGPRRVERSDFHARARSLPDRRASSEIHGRWSPSGARESHRRRRARTRHRPADGGSTSPGRASSSASLRSPGTARPSRRDSVAAALLPATLVGRGEHGASPPISGRGDEGAPISLPAPGADEPVLRVDEGLLRERSAGGRNVPGRRGNRGPIRDVPHERLLREPPGARRALRSRRSMGSGHRSTGRSCRSSRRPSAMASAEQIQ